MKKGIIFDLDGTLWDSTKQVVKAFNEVLAPYQKQITEEIIAGFMGKTLDEIAKNIFPDLEPSESLKLLKACCDQEQIYLEQHGGILYPHLETCLARLKEDYHLYIVSNCQDGYIQAFLDYHQLHAYFEDFEMAGRTGKCKGENIKLVIQRQQLDWAVYVGDTQSDLDGADLAQIPFIWASYGFGQVSRTVPTLKTFEELPQRIDELLEK